MIAVTCSAPKRAKGQHNFTGHEEFALWVVENIRSGKNYVGPWLCALAERGTLNVASGWYCIDATSDFSGGYSMKQLAREVGVIKTKMGCDSYPKKSNVALQYAQRLDVLSQAVEVSP